MLFHSGNWTGFSHGGGRKQKQVLLSTQAHPLSIGCIAKQAPNQWSGAVHSSIENEKEGIVAK